MGELKGSSNGTTVVDIRIEQARARAETARRRELIACEIADALKTLDGTERALIQRRVKELLGCDD